MCEKKGVQVIALFKQVTNSLPVFECRSFPIVYVVLFCHRDAANICPKTTVQQFSIAFFCPKISKYGTGLPALRQTHEYWVIALEVPRWEEAVDSVNELRAKIGLELLGNEVREFMENQK